MSVMLLFFLEAFAARNGIDLLEVLEMIVLLFCYYYTALLIVDAST